MDAFIKLAPHCNAIFVKFVDLCLFRCLSKKRVSQAARKLFLNPRGIFGGY